MRLWELMYDVVGITLIIVIIVVVYKVYILSKDSRQGIARQS